MNNPVELGGALDGGSLTASAADGALPVAIWEGSFNVCGRTVRCSVLDDGRRIIHEDDILALLMAPGPLDNQDDGLLALVKWSRSPSSEARPSDPQLSPEGDAHSPSQSTTRPSASLASPSDIPPPSQDTTT